MNCGATCEYWLGLAVVAAELGRLEAAQDALDWAALASLSAFSVAGSAA